MLSLLNALSPSNGCITSHHILALLSQKGLALRRIHSSGHGVLTAPDMVHRPIEETKEFGKFPSPIPSAF